MITGGMGAPIWANLAIVVMFVSRSVLLCPRVLPPEATRTIENSRDELTTILINQFMSCAARLPTYMHWRAPLSRLRQASWFSQRTSSESLLPWSWH